MKIEPKAGPTINSLPTGQTQVQRSARERAIAAFVEGQKASSAPPPVANANSVTLEELPVVSATSEVSAVQAVENKAEIHTNESPNSQDKAEATPKAESSEETPLSNQYANLARKEKALRAKAQAQDAAYKAKEAELLAREEALKARDAEYSSKYISKDRFKSDPLSVLTEEGVSYDEITKAILSPQPSTDPRIKAEIEQLKAEVRKANEAHEKARQDAVESQKQQYQQAVAEIRRETQQLVNKDNSFEMIKTTGSINDVVELIEKTYNEDKIMLTVEEAAREVEEYLVEEAYKLTKAEKIKLRIAAESAKTATNTAQKQEPNKQSQSAPVAQAKTLTNANSVATKPMSRRERAIMAFKGELK